MGLCAIVKSRMKELWQKVIRSKFFWLSLIIVVQSVVYFLAGSAKAYFHMDEVYSYGLANYERVQLYETEDFYNTWHDGRWYDDYLTVGGEERGDLRPVYINQKNDVHPPLFYLLLRLGMELTPEHFSKWTGIILNMIIAAGCTVLLFLIIEKLLQNESNSKIKSLLLTLVVAVSLATISTVVYIRMYELLTFWILLTTYLHLRLLDAKIIGTKLLVAIGATAFLGVLTQYYYIFFMLAMFIYCSIVLRKAGRLAEWRSYFLSLVAAGIASLMIWPFTVVHMFFSNRGLGVLYYLIQPLVLLDNLWKYISVVNRYVFHGLFAVAILAILFLGGKALVKGKQLRLSDTIKRTVGLVMAPTLFYLLVVATVSPFTELRYIAPVCGLTLILVIYIVYRLFGLFWRSKTCNIVMGVVLAVMSVVMPIAGKIEPDVVYRERSGIMDKIAKLHDVPALYVFKTGNDWVFLNDILLFRQIDKSYIAKDLEGNEEQMDRQIQAILKDIDLSDGLLVFINDGQDNIKVMKAVEHATGLDDVEHLDRIVTSDAYYLKRRAQD